MTGPLPPGWVEVRLGELVEVVRGVTYKKHQARSEAANAFIPILRATNINDGLVLDADLVYVPERVVHAEQLLRVGDILLAASSGSQAVVGKSAMLKWPWHGAFGAFCAVLRPNDALEAQYLAHFVASPRVRRRWSGLAAGTNINNLKREHVENTLVPLAPLAEEQRIVSAIDEHFSRIDSADVSLRRARQKLRQLRSSLLMSALDSDWPRVQLGEIAAIDSGPAFQSRFFARAGEGIRLLRGDNIEPGRLRWADERTWPEEMLDGYEHLFVSESDLILAMDRPLISTGLKLAPVRQADLPALLVQRVARIRPDESVLTTFLHFSLQLPRFIPHLLADQTGTQLPHITLRGIRSFAVPLPEIEEQSAIVAELERQLSIVDAMASEIDEALLRGKALRRSVLERAFAGQLLPQDPTDEPAAVLLERIATERTAIAKPSRRKRKVPA